MFQNLGIFQTAMSMARHAGFKQALTSQNVANADTPGYRARAVKSFAEFVPDPADSFSIKATRAGHIGGFGKVQVSSVPTRTGGDPNGNSVDLDEQILNSVDAKRQHDRALAVYRASLGMLRSALSKQ